MSSSSSDAVEFLKYITAEYKLNFTEEDFELLYEKFKSTHTSKFAQGETKKKSSSVKETGSKTCPFMVPSKKGPCGLKLKKDQLHCTRHEKVLVNRAQKKPLKSQPKPKSESNDPMRDQYLINDEGVVTHRKLPDQQLAPLNQQDIDLCEKKGLKYREPDLEDFLEAEADLEELQVEMNDLNLQRTQSIAARN